MRRTHQAQRSVKLAMQVVVSLAVLGLGIFLVVTVDWKENPELGGIGAAFIGTIVGYWLKSS